MRVHLAVHGTVQGVGFRPFVHREAQRFAVTGWICNAHGTVEIEAQAPSETLDRFVAALWLAPPPARVDAVHGRALDEQDEASFEIRRSETTGAVHASLPPDLAPCAACLSEMAETRNRRHRYPFTTCARCGPRYSIALAMPYDRRQTTMSQFLPCDGCDREYGDASDRRFHAETVACPDCGPTLELLDEGGAQLATGAGALFEAAEFVRRGSILAIRGVGGFQLVVDAASELAVSRLRDRKHRDDKAFAVLMPSVIEAHRHVQLSDAEIALLSSPEAPIVLLQRRSDGSSTLANGVAPGNPELGLMLPASPLHRLLAEEVGRPLVCTSGNRSGEPLCVDAAEAVLRLRGIADAYLTHDRPIARPLDDSVARVRIARTEVLRRARGYAPRVVAKVDSPHVILALGAHFKSAPALLTGGEIILGPHVGDLDNPKALAVLERAVADLLGFFDAKPDAVACDEHPDYASSILAQKLAQKLGVELIPVQHHHAHVAAIACEHLLDVPALGIAWDGTGLGSDGSIWGSEFLTFHGAAVIRRGCLRPYRLPGGDGAARAPWRSAMGMLAAVDPAIAERFGLRWRSEVDVKILLDAAERGINAPASTSMGRFFDAVAAIVGFRSHCTFEGQAAMELEFAARNAAPEDPYPFPIDDGDPVLGDWRPLLRAVGLDVDRRCPPGAIAARFHASLVSFAVRLAERAQHEHVVLSGGCFQNRLLATSLEAELCARGHRVLGAGQVPCNDGGISVGQAGVAAARLSASPAQQRGARRHDVIG
jgi:hydrogenase maturation protein HypF